MSNNNSENSAESFTIDNMLTSQNTHNKSQKNLNLKLETKDINNLSNQNSGDEELLRNKIIMSSKELDLFSKEKLNSNEMNITNKKDSLAFSLSPIKKGGKKRNLLINIMEKSKKNNAPKRQLVIFTQELRFKEENVKNERKDVYGVPINRRNRKKIKVTFSDTLNSVNSKNGKNQLAEIIPIVSYKKYNYIEGFPREEDMATNKSTCQCCLIN